MFNTPYMTLPETESFYDAIAEHYHLFYRDWKATMQRESGYLRRAFRGYKKILDASCGIGTQAIALAQLGFEVTAVDPSQNMLHRAMDNARQFDVTDDITFARAGFLDLPRTIVGPFDGILTKGNALTHLLTDDDLLAALRNFYDLLRPGGQVMIGIRDFDMLLEDRPRFIPGNLHVDDAACDNILFDVWDWIDGDPVLVIFNKFIVSGKGDTYTVKRYPVTYRALTRAELESMMAQIGFVDIKTESQGWEIVVTAKRPE